MLQVPPCYLSNEICQTKDPERRRRGIFLAARQEFQRRKGEDGEGLDIYRAFVRGGEMLRQRRGGP